MKRILMLSAVAAVALSSCSLIDRNVGTNYTLGKQPAAGDLTVVGGVNVRRGDMVMTSARVTGLKADTFYVAHYHVQGTASADPCKSGGAPIMASKIVGKSDSSGYLALNGEVATSVVTAATYFNVHTAADAAGTPADAGVACTGVRL
ncbi:superoxide dismutase [Deinococcus sp. Arct2-2]|uniref:superoxide dismutase n=1 Tax=Deinococcus sp. Arct2-2 TaxID=2568653 RepID=UPI0010A5682B|nr:superoxide dismutase [Deinococcus sp. Arct2-2]THF71103.1 superoxide dismutase [Deinococcus sp. Arct2-2]